MYSLFVPGTIAATATALLLSASPSSAFQNLIPNFGNAFKPASPSWGNVDLENLLLSAIEANGDDKRLDNSAEISSLVTQLENCGQSIPRPAVAPQLYGKWRLLQTTNADTASPIQRKAVDTTKFNIYQDFVFADDDDANAGEEEKRLLVRQIVKFSETNELCVDALASTSAYPLAELTDREGTGKILGLNILGVSMVGEEAAEDPERPDSRVLFVFDEGRFNLGGFTIPYPVPFRNPLFRDAVKGWIDITYLSDKIRISRGNKGTTFILRKEDE